MDVPTIVTQERVQHRQVEHIVEVPVPMIQEEIVHPGPVWIDRRVGLQGWKQRGELGSSHEKVHQ